MPGSATEWTQFRGPTHDGISNDRINKQWTGAVTNALWYVPLTNGFSSLAISRGRVFTQFHGEDGDGDKEICVALDAATGAQLWASALDEAIYEPWGGPDDGPRTTPAVENGAVFVLTSYLKLYKLNVTNGAAEWRKDLRELYGGNADSLGSHAVHYQNGASPVLEGGLIFLNCNSTNLPTLLAMHTSDGSVAWASQTDAMAHATPTLATIQGVRQVIFATQSGLVSLNPTNGNLLWRANYPFSFLISVAPSPVVYQDMIYACGFPGYGMGAFVVRASFTSNTWSTTQLWAQVYFSAPAASHWMTPVACQGFLYGQFGVQGYDNEHAQLKCVDIQTGEVKWSVPDFGRGGTIFVDGHLLSLTEKGDLVLVKPDPNAYVEVARFGAITNYLFNYNRCWNMPAVSDGRVYLRSSGWAAAFDLSVPNLKLDPPQLVQQNRMRLTIRTADGSAVNSNRIVAMEVRASTNLNFSAAQWTKLTNDLVLTNGTVRVENLDATPPRQFFLVSEPK